MAADLSALNLGIDFDEADPTITHGALFDDVVVTHLPELSIVDMDTFQKVLALRPRGGGAGTGRPTGRLHPLVSKIPCFRCGAHKLRYDGRKKWLRCPGATAGWVQGGHHECDAPPVDSAPLERMMFDALDTFRPGREAGFAAIARERYDEIVKHSMAEKVQLEEQQAHHRSEIKGIAKQLGDPSLNAHLRASLFELVEEHSAMLDTISARLIDYIAEPDAPNASESLMELQNMIDKVKIDTPFGPGVNRDSLEFMNRLSDAIKGIVLVEKGDDVYDVEFQLDASSAMGMPGEMVELVRFAAQDLKAGQFKVRKKWASHVAGWESGRFSISDRAWKKRPALPLGERTFCDDLRWVVDCFIALTETGLGVRAVSRLCGTRVASHRMQFYRSTEEGQVLMNWLLEVRPRKHEYKDFEVKRASALTLRARMEAVEHPFLHLKRMELCDAPAPLTDAEWDLLADRLPEVECRFAGAMRYRVDQLIDMLRADRYANWGGKQCFRGWLVQHTKRGTILRILNFFRELEEQGPLDRLPEIPGSRQLLGERKRQKETASA